MSETLLKNWRRRAAAVVAGLALAVPLGFVSSTPAQAHGCSHETHYTSVNGYLKHDHYHYHHYYNGAYYHHWDRYQVYSDGSHRYEYSFLDCRH